MEAEAWGCNREGTAVHGETGIEKEIKKREMEMINKDRRKIDREKKMERGNGGKDRMRRREINILTMTAEEAHVSVDIPYILRHRLAWHLLLLSQSRGNTQ